MSQICVRWRHTLAHTHAHIHAHIHTSEDITLTYIDILETYTNLNP